MAKENVSYKINKNVEKSLESDMYFNGYLNHIIDLKIRTSISGAVNFFKLSSVKELLDGINAGNISILSKPDLKIGKDIIRLPHIAFVYRTILEATSDNSGIILKYLSDNKHIIYETSLLSDELKIAGLFDNIESIIKTTINKMVEECEKQLELKKVKLINQITIVIKSILKYNQISVSDFKDNFIAGKAKLVTLSENGNFVPFIFINYNGENYNTNITLETVSELFEKDVVNLEEVTKLLISYL